MAQRKKEAPESLSLISAEVQKYRELLARDRFHGTIKQKRKEYVKKIAYLMGVVKGKTPAEALDNICYVGLNVLTPEQATDVMQLTAATYKKFRRDFQELQLVVHVKKYTSGGKRAKYSVHLRLVGPNTVKLLANRADWDLRLALHKAFDNLSKEATHKFKKDVTPQRRKTFFRA